MRGNECPHALETVATKTDGQAAVGLLFEKIVGSSIPDLHGSGPVLAFRDLSLERAIRKRMILDVNGEMP